MACGSSLEDVSGEERRLVTVLFADIAGFALRFERADPEDISAALRPFHGRLQQEIESIGGTVDKVAGDVVFGVFGAPVAHEDDAERAVRAALKVRDWVHALNDEDPARALGIRIGIESGEAMVVLGRGPRVGERITGDVVNTASRLQSTAAPDSIVVGEAAHAATDTQFRWEELPPVTVKGKAAPVGIWRPLAPLARIGVEPPDPLGAAFVGREADLEHLRAAFAEVSRERTPRMVTIVGEAGLGKSRLIAELVQHTDGLPELIRWRVGRPLAYGEGTAFAPLGEVVQGEAGILDSDRPETAINKLDAVLGRVAHDEEQRSSLRRHLAPLVGGDDLEGEASREEAFTAWATFVELLAAENVTVLAFEDMHEASEALLAFLEHVLERRPRAPILLLLAGRPELFDLRPDWGTWAGATTIRLSPLSDDETARLVGSLVDIDQLDPELRRSVVDRAGGNPLYAEEFVRMLRDRQAGGFASRAASDDIPVPSTIHALLASRLDALPPGLKASVQDSAVVGSVVWPGALAAVSGMVEDEALARLRELDRRQLVRRARSSAVAEQEEFAFRHVLVHDVAYGQIPRRERARAHLRTAAWLDAALGPGAADRSERLAYHYAGAYDLAIAAGVEDTAAEAVGPAVEHLLSAGERAWRLDAPRALAHQRRALALMPHDHPELPRALRGAGVAAQAVGAFDEAERHLRTSIEASTAAGDVAGAADAKVSLARSLFERGDTEAVAPMLTEAVRELRGLPHGSAYAHAATRIAGHLWVMGDLQRCVRWADRALALARELDRPQEEVLALQYRGASRSRLGDPGGLEDLREALRRGRDRGLGEETAVAYNNYAYELWFHRGSWQALDAWEEMLSFCDDRGLATSRAWARGGMLEPLFDVGAWDRALSIAGDLRLWDEDHGGETQPGTVALTFQGWIAFRRGELEVARSCASELRKRAEHLGTAEYLTPSLTLDAEVALATGDRERAREHLDRFLEVTSDQPVDRTMAMPVVARLLVDAGEPELIESLVGPEAEEVASSQRLKLSLLTARAVSDESMGHHERALERYDDASRRWEPYGFPVETALCRLGAARCLSALGLAAEASSRLRDARSTFEALGARPWLDEVARAGEGNEPT
jgi:class 3 adenylate cyclase/tetratricopeptide (TPR) repeat protein